MNKCFAMIAAAGFLCGLGALAVPGAMGAAAPAGGSESAETGAVYKKLTDAVGPALVTVKFVMKVEGGGRSGGGGRDMEITGLMMEPNGLVLVSNAKMGGLAARRGITASATDIRILAGDDTEGVKAKILARDSEMDLCWIQVDRDEKEPKTFAAVNFASDAKGEVGDKVYVVDRMGKFFDHALSVEEGRIGGATKRPRPLLIPAGFRSGEGQFLGTPILTADGKIVGVTVLQLPDKEDAEGGESASDGSVAILLLPSAEVVKATARGKEMAAKQPKEEPKTEEKKDEKSAAPEKMDDK